MALIDELDAEFIANSIIIDTFKGYNILVEGETDDLFFSKFLSDSLCQIEVCHGKQKLLDVLQIINSHSKKKDKTIGIADKDFDFIVPSTVSYPFNLLFTDNHDVEMMCVYSNSFQYFLNEYCSKIKLNHFLAEVKSKNLKEYVLNITKPIAAFRIVSQIDNLNLAFKQTKEKSKELDFRKFICKDKFTFKGYPQLIEAVKTYYNQGTKLDTKNIEVRIQSLSLEEQNIYDICKGHDLTRILVIGLLKRIGKSTLTNLTIEELERSLRLSFSLLDFNKTQLKKNLDLINPALVKQLSAA